MGIDLLPQRIEKAHGRHAISINAQVRQNEWAQEPSPDGTLVVATITLPCTATVMPLISWLALREAAEPVRSNKPPRADVYDSLLLYRGERTVRQRNAEDLIRPERGIISNSRR